MKRLAFLPIFIILLMPNFSFANGEALFKAKCSTCHALDRNSTGPMLQGVKAKWEDADEGNLLYQWVQNSNQLIASGKSSMAKAIQGYSAQNMPAQQVTNEEVDAILAYIDGWEDITNPPPTDEEAKVMDYSSYDSRLTMAYILGGMLLLLLLAVMLTSNVLVRLMKHGIQLKRLNRGRIPRRALFFIAGIIAIIYAVAPNSIGGTGISEQPPWLLIESYQLYVLLGINIILVLVLVRLKSLFQVAEKTV